MILTPKTYTSCSDLPLYNFIKIVVFNDLEQLYVSKLKIFHKKVDLISLWDKIFDEYSQLSDNTQSGHMLELLKSIKEIEFKLNIISSCLQVLSNCVKHNLNVIDYQLTIDTLKSYGFYHEYSNLTLLEDIKHIISGSKTLNIELADLIEEYKKIDTAKESAATEKDFIDEVALISSFHKIQINTKQISVMEYISYLSLFKKANA